MSVMSKPVSENVLAISDPLDKSLVTSEPVSEKVARDDKSYEYLRVAERE
jgi:hypothetical protein